MARILEPTEEQLAEWNEWVAARPEHVRRVAKRFDPFSLYRMKSTGSRVTLVGFGEHDDGSVTMTIYIGGKFNAVIFERQVFGVSPDDLEPCELPGADEPLGVLLTDDAAIDAMVETVRPIIVGEKACMLIRLRHTGARYGR